MTLERTSLKIDLIFFSLIVIAFCIVLTTGRLFPPVEANFSGLASDAIEGAVSSFVAPIKEAVDQPPSDYQPKYDTGRNFLAPAALHMLATLFIIAAMVIYVYYKEWDRTKRLSFITSALMFLLSGMIGIIFAFKGLKYLLYGLFHSAIFLGVLLFLGVIFFAVISAPFRSSRE
jgi:heme A synthase